MIVRPGVDPVTRVIGVELIVEDLDRAVELFTEVLGLELLSRGPAPTVAGEAAVIDAGAFAITLLAPAAGGPGHVLAERTPRLNQLVVGLPALVDVEVLRDRATEAGLAVRSTDGGSFYLVPEAVAGALGQEVAVVVTAVAEP